MRETVGISYEPVGKCSEWTNYLYTGITLSMEVKGINVLKIWVNAGKLRHIIAFYYIKLSNQISNKSHIPIMSFSFTIYKFFSSSLQNIVSFKVEAT